MPSISAHELRAHYGRTAPLAPRPTAQPAPLNPLAILAGSLTLESLTISADAMPGHFIARAVVLDLQPSQMVAAIMATEDRIKQKNPRARRTGWSATSDGLRIYFYAWQ